MFTLGRYNAGMRDDRRRLWPSIIVMALVAPFIALVILSMLAPAPKGGGAGDGGPIISPPPAEPSSTQSIGQTASPPAAESQPATNSAAASPAQPAAASAPAVATAPANPERPVMALLAAGDGRDVWVAHGIVNEGGVPGFELLLRSEDSPGWQIAVHDGDDDFWSDQGMPRALMLLEPAVSGSGRSAPVVVGQNGYVDRYFLDHNAPLADLPRDQVLRAAAGAPDELFAVLEGTPPANAMQPGDALHPSRLKIALPGAASEPAATPHSSIATATAAVSPATSAPAPAPGALAAVPVPAAATRAGAPGEDSPPLNVYWFGPPAYPAASTSRPAKDVLASVPGDWTVIEPLPTGGNDPASGPLAQSEIALAVNGERLMAIWADARLPGELCMRTLDFRKAANPGPRRFSRPCPRVNLCRRLSRLMTVQVNRALYVLWTVPTGASVALHGGWIETSPAAAEGDRYHLLPAHFVKPMSLGTAGQGVSPASDVTAAASANSILVAVMSADKTLSWLLFDGRGNPLSGPAPAEATQPQAETQFGQNLMVFLLAVMLALSIWQWRKKPAPVSLPEGRKIAPFYLRLLAIVIDLLLAYVAVLVIFGAWENGGYYTLAESWFGRAARPEELFLSPPFLVFLGIHLAEVTLGELFFRRSIGKAATGLEVLMLDGKSPTVWAILLRNLVRIPECALGVALLYMLLSERGQRLGDYLAHTLVVAEKGPATPEDPDREK